MFTPGNSTIDNLTLGNYMDIITLGTLPWVNIPWVSLNTPGTHVLHKKIAYGQPKNSTHFEIFYTDGVCRICDIFHLCPLP